MATEDLISLTLGEGTQVVLLPALHAEWRSEPGGRSNPTPQKLNLG